jgi:hypothetical protein
MAQQPEILTKHGAQDFFNKWHHYLVPFGCLLCGNFIGQASGLVPAVLALGVQAFGMEYYRRNNK